MPPGVFDRDPGKRAGAERLQPVISKTSLVVLTLVGGLATACTPAPQYDVVIRHGTVYDGTGGAPVVGDLAIQGDRIAVHGDVGRASGRLETPST